MTSDIPFGRTIPGHPPEVSNTNRRNFPGGGFLLSPRRGAWPCACAPYACPSGDRALGDRKSLP